MVQEISSSSPQASAALSSTPDVVDPLSTQSNSLVGSSTSVLPDNYQPALCFLPQRESDRANQIIGSLVAQMNSMLQMLLSLVSTLVQKLLTQNQTQQTPSTPTTTPSNGGGQNTPTGTTTGQTNGTTSQTPTTTTPITTTTTPECKCDNDQLTPDTEVKPKVASPLSASGFLWKPVAEKDGKLVVLVPSKLTGKVKSVKITDKNGTLIANGKYSGVGNGDREHFRFPKAGESYPDGLRVVIELKDGSTRYVTIKETSKRYQR